MKKINVVITAGGTNEKVDEVRKITNMSTGALGVKLAKEVVSQLGNNLGTLYYICSKHAKQPQVTEGTIKILHAESAEELSNAIQQTLQAKSIHYFIHSAAVSDYATDYVSDTDLLSQRIEREVSAYLLHLQRKAGKEEFQRETLRKRIHYAMTEPDYAKIDNTSKISSKSEDLMVVLKPTEKIISKIKEWSPRTFLVGFKLLNGVSEETLFDTAFALLRKNRCNLVLANDLKTIRKGEHIGMLVYPEKKEQQLIGKENIAKTLVETMLKRGETRYPKSLRKNEIHHVPDDLFQTFQTIGTTLYEKRLLPIVEGGTYGNMSVRNEQGFYITGRNVQKGDLTKDMLVEVEKVDEISSEKNNSIFAEITYNGRVKPSIDTAIHSFIYQNTNHQAILHVHTDQLFEGFPLTDYNYACGTEKEMQSILAPILQSPQETIIQMNKHGLIVMGQTLEECLEKLVLLLDNQPNIDPLQPSVDQKVWEEWVEHMKEVGETPSPYDFYNTKNYYVVKKGNEKLGVVFVKEEAKHLSFSLYSLKEVQGKRKNVAGHALQCLTLLAKTKNMQALQLVTKSACGVKEFYETKYGFTLVEQDDFIKMKKDL